MAQNVQTYVHGQHAYTKMFLPIREATLMRPYVLGTYPGETLLGLFSQSTT
jgi:hypothetical protein